MMEQYVALLSNFGFPIVMVLWFMIRTEKVIKNNTEIMKEVIKKL